LEGQIAFVKKLGPEYILELKLASNQAAPRIEFDAKSSLSILDNGAE